MLTLMRTRIGTEDGSAIVEFVFVAVLVMVPLVYLIVAVASVQSAQLAVTNAAREAGRALATADSVPQGMARARVAARFAFEDAGLDDAPDLRFVPVGSGCSAATVAPTLRAGAEFTVCVTRHTALPAVPSILAGRGIINEGRFVVHVNDYRAATE